MESQFSLTLDQVDEIQKHLRRANAVSRLVAELSAGRKQWPEDFSAINLGTVMNIILEDVEGAQEIITACTTGTGKEAEDEPTT
jgi:hypothetical protein